MTKPINALSYIYHKAQTERDVNLINIYNVVKNHIRYERLSQFQRFLEITGKVAVHSLKMSEHSRRKHRDVRFNFNGHTYYVLDRLAVWSVGIVQQPEQYFYD